MKPRWEHVVVVCPERVTGGPEALHQLGHMLNKLGGEASMAYVWGPSLTVMDGQTISCDASNSPTGAAYAEYRVPPIGGVEVFPKGY